MHFGNAGLAVTIGLLLLATTNDADARRRRLGVYAPPKSSLVWDANAGAVLHAANADELRYPASLTKIMTLYLLFEAMEAKKLSPASDLRVSAHAAEQAPSKLGLKPGETIKVHQAIGALATKSANDAAVVVAEAISGSEDAFARRMTMRARALGMSRTTFRNASGLPDLEQKTTARDMATLARAVLERFPRHAGVFQTKSFHFRGRAYRNHNSLLYSYAGMEGMKTGFTSASGFNLVGCARRGSKHVIAVVMGGNSAGSRNATMRGLLNAAWSKASAVVRPGRKLVPRPTDGEALVARAASPENTVLLAGAQPQAVDQAKPAAIAAAAAPVSPPLVSPAAVEVIPPAIAPQAPAFRSRPAVANMAGFRDVELAVAPQRLPVPEAMPFRPATPLPAALAAAQPAPIAQRLALAEPAAAAGTTRTDASDGVPAAGGPAFHIQVGSHSSETAARAQLAILGPRLGGHAAAAVAGDVGGKTFWRARFTGFGAVEAKAACAKLKKTKTACMVVKAQ